MSDLIELRNAMRRFTEERDWERFHDPKSLLLALVGEVGELSELFQWLPADVARELAGEEPLRERVGEELADVLLYLVRLADVLELDSAKISRRKLEKNAVKHGLPGSDYGANQAPLARPARCRPSSPGARLGTPVGRTSSGGRLRFATPSATSDSVPAPP